MARSKEPIFQTPAEPVLLGFEDEPILEKHADLLGPQTNKIGGSPDWTTENTPHPSCTLCGLPQLLVVQIYAPLHGSVYHRTLYVFCCINQNCWNLSGSWTCLRQQRISCDRDSAAMVEKPSTDVTVWCQDADDWPSDNDDNGNILMSPVRAGTDSDDSSSLSLALGSLRVDQCNANAKWAGCGDTDAEIEGDEAEVVTIDTPTRPAENLLNLLITSAPLPKQHHMGGTTFHSSFLYVSEELTTRGSDEHVQQLLKTYKTTVGEVSGGDDSNGEGRSGGCGGEDEEKYERAVPLHGDVAFHRFLSRLQANPGQILRYCRDGKPLLIYPLQESPGKCRHCQSELVFEFQLLPSIISKLKLVDDSDAHIEFGNVLIYTCQTNCWSTESTCCEEVVVVQAENLQLN